MIGFDTSNCSNRKLGMILVASIFNILSFYNNIDETLSIFIFSINHGLDTLVIVLQKFHFFFQYVTAVVALVVTTASFETTF